MLSLNVTLLPCTMSLARKKTQSDLILTVTPERCLCRKYLLFHLWTLAGFIFICLCLLLSVNTGYWMQGLQHGRYVTTRLYFEPSPLIFSFDSKSQDPIQAVLELSLQLYLTAGDPPASHSHQLGLQASTKRPLYSFLFEDKDLSKFLRPREEWNSTVSPRGPLVICTGFLASFSLYASWCLENQQLSFLSAIGSLRV